MIIIGITGTLGAGKGTVVERLKDKYHFEHCSARDFITKEIIKRGLPVNRDTMTDTGNALRAEHDPAYIVTELYRMASQSGKNAVIESIRTPGEIDALRHKENFTLFAVDADPKVRYERIRMRKSATDDVTFEKFLADEKREYESDDPNKQNLKYCIDHADHVFQNDTSFEDLENQVDVVMKRLLIKAL